MKQLLSFIFILILTPLVAYAQVDKKPLVVIDAAHGGSDAGVKEGSEKEKEWNLKFAEALQKAFEDVGFQILMTRTSDSSLDPETRLNQINSSKAHVVLVIHADREWTRTQNGPFLVVEPPNQNGLTEADAIQTLGQVNANLFHASLKLAQDIGTKLGVSTTMSELSDSRGGAGSTVTAYGRVACLPHQSLRYLTKPAVVLTPLFLTSASDLKKYGDDKAVADFSLKVVQGVCAYLQLPMPTSPTPEATSK